jgi:hypothetical protein
VSVPAPLCPVVPEFPTPTADPFAGASGPLLDSLDWDFFFSALQPLTSGSPIEPPVDFNVDPWGVGFPGMVESFSPKLAIEAIGETSLNWEEIDGFSLDNLDPFEAHRVHIIDYLRRSGQTTSCQLTYFSAQKVRVYFHMYFVRFHRHSGFLHAPTFDVRKISTWLFFAVCLLGALHCGESDTIDAIKPIWPLADAMVSSQLQVFLQRIPLFIFLFLLLQKISLSRWADPRMQRLEHPWHWI